MQKIILYLAFSFLMMSCIPVYMREHKEIVIIEVPIPPYLAPLHPHPTGPHPRPPIHTPIKSPNEKPGKRVEQKPAKRPTNPLQPVRRPSTDQPVKAKPENKTRKLFR